MKSALSRSASLPVETSLAKPMPRSAARDSSEPRMPPLCETSEIRPGRQALDLERAGGGEHDAVGQVDQADGVRPQQPHAAGGLAQGKLAGGALRARLAIAAGQHDGRRRAARGEVAHRLFRAVGADQDDADIGCRRQRGDVGVAGQPGDARRPRVHRPDGAGEAVLLQVADGAAGHLGRVGRGADDGDARRADQLADRAHAARPRSADLARKAATDSWCSRVE